MMNRHHYGNMVLALESATHSNGSTYCEQGTTFDLSNHGTSLPYYLLVYFFCNYHHHRQYHHHCAVALSCYLASKMASASR